MAPPPHSGGYGSSLTSLTIAKRRSSTIAKSRRGGDHCLSVNDIAPDKTLYGKKCILPELQLPYDSFKANIQDS